jgi:hypothetical protein
LSKEFHDLSVDQNYVPEIDSNRTRFFLDYVAKCAHISFCNPAADAQRHKVVAIDYSVDSPGHLETADEALALVLTYAFPTRLLQRRAII